MPNIPSLRTQLKRALLLRCPHCGQGNIFKRYLKLKEHCDSCSESLAHIRADDGPAWLTILIAGHMLVPFALTVVKYTSWPDWAYITTWCITTLLIVLAVLPFSKSIFVHAIWRTGCAGSEKQEESI